MILPNGTSFSYTVMLPSQPDGSIAWSLTGPSGASVASGSVTPDPDAVSAIISINASYNTLSGGSFQSYRDLNWSYTVAGATVAGTMRYLIERSVPFGVSPDGVRSKLGVSPEELPDSEIATLTAYLSFRNTVTATILDGLTPDEGLKDALIRNAIEALAAIALIPTMRTRIANKESSGTDTFQREKIDWEALGGYLEQLVSDGLTAVSPDFDVTVAFGTLFIIASPSADPFTGVAIG